LRFTSTPRAFSRRRRHVSDAVSASFREEGTCTGTILMTATFRSSAIRSRERSGGP